MLKKLYDWSTSFLSILLFEFFTVGFTVSVVSISLWVNYSGGVNIPAIMIETTPIWMLGVFFYFLKEYRPVDGDWVTKEGKIKVIDVISFILQLFFVIQGVIAILLWAKVLLECPDKYPGVLVLTILTLTNSMNVNRIYQGIRKG